MPKNNYRNAEQDRRLGEIEKSIKVINGELGSIKVDIAKIKGRLGVYAVIVPVLTGVLGFLLSKFF